MVLLTLKVNPCLRCSLKYKSGCAQSGALMFGGTVFARIDDESWLVTEIEPDEFLSDVLQTAGYILLCAEAFR